MFRSCTCILVVAVAFLGESGRVITTSIGAATSTAITSGVYFYIIIATLG